MRKDIRGAVNSRVDPAEESGFKHAAADGDMAQRKRDKDARRDHDGAIRRRSERVEERDVLVRRRRRRHPGGIRERKTVAQRKGALGNERTPRGLIKKKSASCR